MTANAYSHRVSQGDVIYPPPVSRHSLRNVADSEDLEKLCIWWGGGQATAE